MKDPFENSILDSVRKTASYKVNSKEVKVTGGIIERHIKALFNMIRQHRPQIVLEIGMGFGISTLTILNAIRANGNNAMLWTIEPDQGAMRDTALEAIEDQELSAFHQLINEPDYVALPKLLQDDAKIEFAYIDGCHIFDYVMIDMFYVDKLLQVGGIIGFNDCGWRGVDKTIRFMNKFRKYEMIESGLTKDFTSQNILYNVIKRFSGRSNEDKYFCKKEQWEPSMGTGYFRYF